jgi:nucleoside-diphosphate-sugar epimerase
MRIVITGGAGFLGRHVAAECRDLARERAIPLELCCVDLVTAPHADRSILADVTDASAMQAAVRGADVVLHMASLIDWGTLSHAALARVNVGGTQTVIDACKREGVKALVYTSSMDVLLDGQSHDGVDETAPYPTRFQDHYCATKAEAEQLVLAANSAALRTCSLRPCGMFGENDPYHLDNVLRAARKGLPFRIGAPDTVFQHVYVGNVAFAHALAAFAIREEDARICGRAYFCTDVPAQNFFEMLKPFVEAKGYRLPAPTRRLPDKLAYGLGALAEGFAKVMPRRLGMRPKMTRSSVLTLTHSFSIRSTRLSDDLGYAPRYSPEQAFERTMAHYAHHDP